MPNVVRFTLSTARDLLLPGVGMFDDGVLDIDANDIDAIGRARYLIQPYGAVEIGIVDASTPPPDLPAVPEAPNPDPYPQYLTVDELLSDPVVQASFVPAVTRVVDTDWNDAVLNGWYMSDTAVNSPTPGSWVIGLVERHNDLYVTQTLHEFIGDSASDTRLWRRSSYDEAGVRTWGTWLRLRVSETEIIEMVNAMVGIDLAPAEHAHVSTDITDWTEALQDAVAAFFGVVPGQVTYDDAAGEITISGIGGTFDPEATRDAIGAALIGVGVISVAINDAGDTISISTTATDRATHTGTQAISTVTGLQTALDGKIDAADGVGVVAHGATAGVARPSGYASVMWIGSVEPTNAVDDTDTWLDTSA